MAGRILVPTRIGAWILCVLALANAVYLYFTPSSTRTRYAWSIKPPAKRSIGDGFLAGTLATALVLLAAARWRSFEALDNCGNGSLSWALQAFDYAGEHAQIVSASLRRTRG